MKHLRETKMGLVTAVFLASGMCVFQARAQQAASPPTGQPTASSPAGKQTASPPVAQQTASPPAAPQPSPPATTYQPPPANQLAAIPAGSTLRVKLQTTLTDKTNNTGDPFTGEVTDPIMVNGKEIVPKYSTVDGHVAFIKPSGRIAGKAQMRIVVDKITTPDGAIYPLNGSLEQAQGGVCAHTTVQGKTTKADEEGTITGCGKSKKDALKDAAIVGAMGAGVGASIGLGHEIECEYYGICNGSMAKDIGYGAGIGAGTALIYNLFKHEKHIVLVEGTELTFTVNRTSNAEEVAQATNTKDQK